MIIAEVDCSRLGWNMVFLESEKENYNFKFVHLKNLRAPFNINKAFATFIFENKDDETLFGRHWIKQSWKQINTLKDKRDE